MRPTCRRSLHLLFVLVLLSFLLPLASGPAIGAYAQDQPQAAPQGSTLLVPDHAFPGGVLTGVVLGPDDKPVPNAPVEVSGGVPITLSGVVIGEEPPATRPQPDHPAPCQPDANGNLPPGCPPTRPTRLPNLPAVNAPQDCAAVLQQAQQIVAQPANQGVDHILIGLSQPSAGDIGPAGIEQAREAAGQPSATAGPGGEPQSVGGGATWISKAGGGIRTDALGRFAVCLTNGTGTAFFKSVSGLKQEVDVTDYKEGGVTPTPPRFVQPNQHINLHGLLRKPGLEQGGNTWLVPAVHAISPNGEQVITAFKTPHDLQPGSVKFTFTDRNGQQQQFTGGVFKILSATLDRSKLRSQEGADFSYTVQFGDASVHPCVQVSVTGPVVLTQAPPAIIAVDASGMGRFGGKIRATQVAPGSAVPFDIIPEIQECREAAQPNPQSQPGQSAIGGAGGVPTNLYTGPTLVNPWGKQAQEIATVPAPAAVKLPPPNLSTGPSHTMGNPTGPPSHHTTTPPPIYVCEAKLGTAPAIGNVVNSNVKPGVFTQEPGRNVSQIHGCNFGDTAGHVYLIFPPASGQPGFGTPVELFLTSPWKSDLLEVMLDQSFGGYLDTDGVILQVVTAKGAKAELPNRTFSAWRVGQTIAWMPASQVKFGSAGSNWITAVFHTNASSQTAPAVILDNAPGPQTATVSRSVTGGGGPFTVQDDLWDFSALRPGFTVLYATPYYDNWAGAGCDQTTGHWGDYWDSATLLRVHVQGCYHKGTGNFSSSTANYGFTIVLFGPKGAPPWPANLK